MQSKPQYKLPITGRFAPSSTGALHFGSLLTAVASYCYIKHLGGRWLIRLEDTDWQRCKPETGNHILNTLAAFGLHSDAPPLWQSKRLTAYEHAIAHLIQHTQAYACSCSRKSIQTYFSNQGMPASAIYPQICRSKTMPAQTTDHHIRFKTEDTMVGFDDFFQGKQRINPQKNLGDMILQRRDGIFNYILTSVVDDAYQKVTHVIRGLDLLELTPCQILLGKALALPPIQQYGHLPLALNAHGQKLSKQNKSAPVQTHRANEVLAQILQALGQPRVSIDSPQNMLKQAIAQWQNAPLFKQEHITNYTDTAE